MRSIKYNIWYFPVFYEYIQFIVNIFMCLTTFYSKAKKIRFEVQFIGLWTVDCRLWTIIRMTLPGIGCH